MEMARQIISKKVNPNKAGINILSRLSTHTKYLFDRPNADTSRFTDPFLQGLSL